MEIKEGIFRYRLILKLCWKETACRLAYRKKYFHHSRLLSGNGNRTYGGHRLLQGFQHE